MPSPLSLARTSARGLGRVLMAPVFVSGGIGAAKDPAGRADLAAPFLDKVREVVPVVPDNATMVRANGVLQVAAATTMALGIKPRLSAAALIVSLVPTTLAGHAFWEHEDEAAKNNHLLQFEKNAALVGGLVWVATGRK